MRILSKFKSRSSAPIIPKNRFAKAKWKERLQRGFLAEALEKLRRYHYDLTFKMLPDRAREVDTIIRTSHCDNRVEDKANDSKFAYYHGNAEIDTWSYEHNFESRNADLIVGTSKTILPDDNSIPIIRSLAPKQIQKLAKRSSSKRNTILIATAMQLEHHTYPASEWTLTESVRRSLYVRNEKHVDALDCSSFPIVEICTSMLSFSFLADGNAETLGFTSMVNAGALDFSKYFVDPHDGEPVCHGREKNTMAKPYGKK